MLLIQTCPSPLRQSSPTLLIFSMRSRNEWVSKSSREHGILAILENTVSCETTPHMAECWETFGASPTTAPTEFLKYAQVRFHCRSNRGSVLYRINDDPACMFLSSSIRKSFFYQCWSFMVICLLQWPLSVFPCARQTSRHALTQNPG